jgi:hypothetical protein
MGFASVALILGDQFPQAENAERFVSDLGTAFYNRKELVSDTICGEATRMFHSDDTSLFLAGQNTLRPVNWIDETNLEEQIRTMNTAMNIMEYVRKTTLNMVADKIFEIVTANGSYYSSKAVLATASHMEIFTTLYEKDQNEVMQIVCQKVNKWTKETFDV